MCTHSHTRTFASVFAHIIAIPFTFQCFGLLVQHLPAQCCPRVRLSNSACLLSFTLSNSTNKLANEFKYSSAPLFSLFSVTRLSSAFIPPTHQRPLTVYQHPFLSVTSLSMCFSVPLSPSCFLLFYASLNRDGLLGFIHSHAF